MLIPISELHKKRAAKMFNDIRDDMKKLNWMFDIGCDLTNSKRVVISSDEYSDTINEIHIESRTDNITPIYHVKNPMGEIKTFEDPNSAQLQFMTNIAQEQFDRLISDIKTQLKERGQIGI